MGAWDMTKKVTMVFATPPTDAWKTASHQKIQTMRGDFKTDGISQSLPGTPMGVDGLGGVREFKDQAAAEEWVAFCNTLSATVGRGIVSSEISDL